MSGFNFRPKTEITFRRYVSFFFFKSHDGRRKKRLKKDLQKHKERRFGLPKQWTPLYCQIAFFL
jgi:hypothetical protein